MSQFRNLCSHRPMPEDPEKLLAAAKLAAEQTRREMELAAQIRSSKETIAKSEKLLARLNTFLVELEPKKSQEKAASVGSLAPTLCRLALVAAALDHLAGFHNQPLDSHGLGRPRINHLRNRLDAAL